MNSIDNDDDDVVQYIWNVMRCNYVRMHVLAGSYTGSKYVLGTVMERAQVQLYTTSIT